MRRITTLTLVFAAALAVGAITAGGAAATKLTLTSNGEVLQPGYTFEIYGALSQDFSINTSEGPVGECAP
jgi:hypothetical protein